jgi:hypothetical protein
MSKSKSKKTSNIKDYLVYRENDKTKAFDLGDHSNDRELIELVTECGCQLVGFIAAEDEMSALDYGKYLG